MELIPRHLAEALPPLSVVPTISLDEPARVKLFTPDSGWTWYVAAYDGTDVCWGLVEGVCLEFGEFALSELRQVRGWLGLSVERDRHFKPRPLAALYAELAARH
jgi:hypothetical protein